MSLFKRLFGKSGVTQPGEPVFPGENFSILKLNMSDGLALATVNKAYENYPNKSFYPFLVGIELEILDKNDSGHPVDTEAARLNQIQDEIETLLRQKHTVHSVARVTRNGTRDILIYIDTPKLIREELNTFFEAILKERQVNFSIQKDASWSAVAGFINL
ncbi:MAG: DUF695 domain-containing protein [Sphingobacteriales bacterium]|nr:DUF695 domain-containing protein [Sphingobacteriales bacterium]OJY91094.1 MAG: hypothetical protein BGP14_06805 [Sphingobacteriales bacterium 44-15]